MRCSVVESVIVSPEMTTLIGTGSVEGIVFPSDAMLLVFGFDGIATVRIAADAASETLGEPEEGNDSISFIVQNAALRRLCGCAIAQLAGETFHLTSDLRAIALKLRDRPMSGETGTTYSIGKSIELLCETVTLLASGFAVTVSGALNLGDSARLVAARRIIDERWSEKLTLDGLARACGINRAKLTRGFRELYHCTVADAITERRLAEASRALLTTDLPVSSIGYASGYLNNASFSRAFGRRFGVSPSVYRVCQVAA